MRTKRFVLPAVVFLMTAFTPHTVHAAARIAEPSAALLVAKTTTAQGEDSRVKKLHAYLEHYNSPLADSAETFIQEADRNRLDWKFVAAISGVESGFGRNMPAGSYNGWGYGIYANHVRYFTSWDDAIHTISSDLRTIYMSQRGAKDVYGIGRMYAADPNWAGKVEHYMNEIDAYEPPITTQPLPISI